jgi:hypothetical protein
VVIREIRVSLFTGCGGRIENPPHPCPSFPRPSRMLLLISCAWSSRQGAPGAGRRFVFTEGNEGNED